MSDISLKQLLEAGCHFGHQVTRWNPKAREFIYTERNNIHIIDLVKTKQGIEQAAQFLKDIASQNGSIIFVGTKRQAKGIIEEEAKKAGVFYVSKRWVGGLITNWEEVKKNLERISNLEEKIKNSDNIYTKAEVTKFGQQLKKLLELYQGIRGLTDLPKALVVVDIHQEDSCVREAQKREIPVVGIVDTNADPNQVDYPIPANDDAVGSIKIIMGYLAEAVLEGKKEGEKKEVTETGAETKKSKKKSKVTK